MNMNQFIHILGQFHQQYPNVTYNLVENGGKMIETQLINDEIDIGITIDSYSLQQIIQC